MSDFSDLLSEGFADMAAECGSTLSFNGLTATVLSGNAATSHELRDAGLWEQGSRVIEMKRADFTRLKLADRATVTLAGKRMHIFVIEDDDADPTMRLHLKPAHESRP